MREYNLSFLTSCFSLYSDPTDITAFGMIVFRSEQLHIEEENGRTMFTHDAGEKDKVQQPESRAVWVTGIHVLTNMCTLHKAWRNL